MLGDTGVAVNVDDSRYKHLHGKSCLHPFTGDRIPIICDEHANMSKGTGMYSTQVCTVHKYVQYTSMHSTQVCTICIITYIQYV